MLFMGLRGGYHRMKTIRLTLFAALLASAGVQSAWCADVSQDFTDWTFSYSPINVTDAGWNTHRCRVLSRVYNSSADDDMAVWMDAASPTYVQTPPLTNGYGTVSFDTASSTGGHVPFSIQTSTNGADPWITRAVFTNTAGVKVWSSWTVDLDQYETAYMRFTREAVIGVQFGIDSIHITDPPTKVDFGEPYTDPGAPQVNQSVDVFCTITPSALASNIVASLIYDTGIDIGTNAMVLTATPNLYQTTNPIPAQVLAGVVINYEIRTTFEGTNAPNSSSVSSFYEVLEKPFDTSYDTMDIIGSETAGMTIISNHLWRGIVNIATTAAGPGFQFSGAHTNGSTTHIWGDNDPSSSALVAYGAATLSQSSFTIDSMPAGDYVFTFNELSGDYVVNSADFNDFDDWINAETVGDYEEAGWSINDGWVSADPVRKRGTRSCYLTNAVGAYVRTPELTNGVGQISFWLRHWETNAPPLTECVVQVSETGASDSNAWTTIATIPVNSTKFNRYVVPRNDRYSRYVRIQNMTATADAKLAIDEFLVAGPGSGVVLSSLTNTPSSPLTTETISISATVEELRGAQTTSVSTYWRTGDSGGFTEISMSEGGGGVWTTTSDIPAGSGDGSDGLGAGTVQYYVAANYNGYDSESGSPTAAPNGGSSDPTSFEVQRARMLYANVTHAPAAPQVNASFTVEADVTPAAGAVTPYVRLYYRIGDVGNWSAITMEESGSNTHFATTTPVPTAAHPGTPVYYFIRTTFGGPSAASPTNFPAGGESDPRYVLSHATPPATPYSSMVVEGDINSAMRLYADHRWVGIASIGVETNPSFRFKGITGSNTNVWGDSNTPAGVFPLFGNAALNDSDIGLSGTYSNEFIFYFDETNGQYWAHSCAHQDFDGFPAVPAPSETPTTDTDGWSVKSATVLTNEALEGSAVNLGGSTTSDWSYARTPVLDGGGEISFWYRNHDETGSRPGTLNIGIRENGGEWATLEAVTNILSTDYLFHRTAFASSATNVEVQLLWSNSNNVPDAPLTIDNFTVENLGAYVTLSGLVHSPNSPTIRDTVDIDVDASVINHATNLMLQAWYRVGTNGLFESTSMAETTPGHYVSDTPIPRGEVGEMEYYVEATFNGPLSAETLYAHAPFGGSEAPASYINTDTNIGAVITFQTEQGWTYTGRTLSTQTNEQWLLNDSFIWGRIETSLGMLTAEGFPSRTAALVNTVTQGGANSFLRSPFLPLGAGVISFDAFSKNLESVDVAIQRSSDGSTGWQTVQTVTTYKADLWTNHVVNLQIEDAIYLRLFKPEQTDNDELVGIDNVEIAYPSARASLDNVEFSPAHPADSDNVTVTCNIESISTFAPALGITARVYYKLEAETSYTAPPIEMTRNGSNFVSSTGIPLYEAGDTVEYYIESTFKGYSRITNFSPIVSPVGTYDVRAHESSYESIQIGVGGESVAMAQVGDSDWIGILSFPDPVSDFPIALEGLDFYDGTNLIEGVATTWGDPGQDRTNLPYSSQMQVGETELLIHGELTGQYILAFNEETGSYTLRRGVYQHFNTWPAKTEFFESSVNTINLRQYIEDFSNTADWPTTPTIVVSEDFDSGWTTSDYPPSGPFPPIKTRGPAYYTIYNGLIVTQVVGHAAMLDPVEGHGWVRTAIDIPNDGSGQIEFDLRCVNDELAPVIHDQTNANVLIEASIEASAMPENLSDDSVGHCYISIISHYVDENRYYELRMVQRRRESDDKLRRGLELWEKDGTGAPFLRKSQGEWDGEIRTMDRLALMIFHPNASKAQIWGYRNGRRELTWDDTSSPINTGYDIGLAGMDADLDVTTFKAYKLTAAAYNRDDEIPLSAFGTGSWDAGGHPWTVSGGHYLRPGYTGDPLSFTVDYIPLDALQFGETLDDSPDWVNAGSYSNHVNTPYVHITTTIDRPEDSFVRVKHTTGTGSLVVDNVSATYWRGLDYDQTNDWQASGVKVKSSSLELRTSTTTNENQFIRSPFLSNGVAIIEFDYKTATTTSDELVFAVRCTAEGDTSDWETGLNIVVTNTPANWTPFAWRLPETNNQFEMYIRIENLSTDWDAGMRIDNIVITEPVILDDDTWRGYNVLVTANETDRLLPEEGNIKGGYINNSPSADTGGIVYTNLPFIETPKLPGGVGEVQFAYRAWDGTSTQIDILAAADRDVPDDQWTLLHSLENISNQTFLVFNKIFYEADLNFLRLRVNSDEGYGRACVDNFFVAAPFASTILIRNVTLSHEIPLDTDRVFVSAEVYDTFLNPSNITLQLVYELGPNNWGTYPNPVRLDMPFIEAQGVYQTTIPIGVHGINPVDTVVQYHVEAEFDGLFSEISSPLKYKTFTNPDHYWPVDLNSGQTNPTPYYVVFSSLPGQVWINELNIADDYAYSGSNFEAISPTQYVEVCGIQERDIGGWKIKSYDVDAGATVTTNAIYSIPDGTYLPADTNGYGFYLLGKPGMTDRDLTLTNDLPSSGGIHLIRSMGAVEHSICYDTYDVEINGSVTNNPLYRFVYVGMDDSAYDTALYASGMGSNLTDFANSYLNAPHNYSPGWANLGQMLVPLTDTNGLSSYEGTLAISSFWSTATSVYMEVAAESNGLAMTPWYSTNLLGASWLEGTNPGQSASGTNYTVWCDRITNAPGAFYKVTTP
jgi:hypothetical protein